MTNSNYSAGEALILKTIQATTSFSANNTSRANWKILNSGKSRQYVVLRAGAFERSQLGLLNIKLNG